MDPAVLVNLVINGGGFVVTLYLLLRVMNRLDAITDRIFTYLEKAEMQRIALMKANGIDPRESGIYKRSDLGLPD